MLDRWKLGAVVMVLTMATPQALAAGATARAPATQDSGITRALEGTAVVEAAGGNGAAVSLDAARLVTAAHVVHDLRSVTIITSSGERRPAEVLAVDSARDIAILLAPNHGMPSPPVRTELPTVGEPVYAAGAPLAEYIQLSAGIVSALPLQDGVRRIQTDASVNPGNSGGPLLDAEGHLIGIVVTKSRTEEGIGWATAASEVEEVIRSTPRVRTGAEEAPDAGGQPSATAPSQSSVGQIWLLGVAIALVLIAGATFVHLRRTHANRRNVSPAPIVILPALDLTAHTDLMDTPAPGLTTSSHQQ